MCLSERNGRYNLDDCGLNVAVKNLLQDFVLIWAFFYFQLNILQTTLLAVLFLFTAFVFHLQRFLFCV